MAAVTLGAGALLHRFSTRDPRGADGAVRGSKGDVEAARLHRVLRAADAGLRVLAADPAGGPLAARERREAPLSGKRQLRHT